MGLLGTSGNGSVVDVPAFLDSAVVERIGQLVAMGLLVSIGTTRDRGAISCQITYDGEWEREYFRRSDEAIDWLTGAIDTLRGRGIGAPGAQAAVTSTPTRGRRRAP